MQLKLCGEKTLPFAVFSRGERGEWGTNCRASIWGSPPYGSHFNFKVCDELYSVQCAMDS